MNNKKLEDVLSVNYYYITLNCTDYYIKNIHKKQSFTLINNWACMNISMYVCMYVCMNVFFNDLQFK